jgi:hypothetical protein
MYDEQDTHPRPPQPLRPVSGLAAWQATLGYISSRYSPDAILKFHVASRENSVSWAASVSWGTKEETIGGQPSLAAALRLLWAEVSANHHIFERIEDTIKSPEHYDDTECLDLPTEESLQRLLWVTQSAYPDGWQLVVIYQPVETANLRLQARLIMGGGRILVGAQGPTLLDVCRTLFRNATPHYASQTPPLE